MDVDSSMTETGFTGVINENRDAGEPKQLQTDRINTYKPDNVIGKIMYQRRQSETRAIAEHEKAIQAVLGELTKILQDRSG
ncbi:hypothetical protein NEMBOFW57_003625 [Staphylotrichum longicolle]|uniref:Uncharacterized protein n=1 Tax=Staphylotrichum longicolle TaxID=669026 RepID=A0AAD4F881_9PEZI|nr:hypothetical protein NEMBOFW57_003625 [Staphylotrichum longicolle]